MPPRPHVAKRTGSFHVLAAEYDLAPPPGPHFTQRVFRQPPLLKKPRADRNAELAGQPDCSGPGSAQRKAPLTGRRPHISRQLRASGPRTGGAGQDEVRGPTVPEYGAGAQCQIAQGDSEAPAEHAKTASLAATGRSHRGPVRCHRPRRSPPRRRRTASGRFRSRGRRPAHGMGRRYPFGHRLECRPRHQKVVVPAFRSCFSPGGALEYDPVADRLRVAGDRPDVAFPRIGGCLY